MKFSRIIFVVLFTLCSASLALSQWKNISANMPSGGAAGITAFTSKAGKLWVASFGGLFMSTDNGATWINRTFPGVAQILSMDFLDASSGLAVTIGELYRTTNAGISWTQITLPGGVTPFMAEFVKNADDIAVMTTTGRVLISHDAGVSWNATVALFSAAVYDMHTRRSGEINVLIRLGRSSSMIAKSVDYGYSWQYSTQFDADCYSFAIDSCDVNKFYVINEEIYVVTDRVAMLYLSNDGGNSWQQKAQTNNLRYFCGSVCVSPGSVIYMQTYTGGITRSTDGGTNWTNIGGPNGALDARFISVASENIVYAMDESGVLWCTENSGGLPLKRIIQGTYSVSPSTPFDNVQTALCDSIDLMLRSSVFGCLPPQADNFDIAGIDSNDYTVVKASGDTIIIRFKPSKIGVRNGELSVTLDNDSVVHIPLRGTGYDQGYTFTATPAKLFESDSLLPCDTIVRTLHFRSRGCIVPQISSQKITGPDSADYELNPIGASILSGNDSVMITFVPKGAGTRTASFTITLRDGKKITIPLLATAIDPGKRLSASPRVLFESDSIALCNSTERTIYIGAGKCTDLHLVTKQLSGAAKDDYSVLYAPDSLSMGDSVTIRFAPSAVGPRDAILTLATGDTTLDVTLMGTGYDKGYLASITKNSLFEQDTIELCKMIEEGFRVISSGCIVPKVVSQIISGAADKDYTLLSPAPDSLTGDDIVWIRFAPGALGVRTAEYELTLSDGKKFVVPLLGTAKNGTYAVTATPPTLFENDSLFLCQDTLRSAVISIAGCSYLRTAKQEIIGAASGDYTLVAQSNDSLEATNNIAIRFAPGAIGLRDAQYHLVISDGKEIFIPLLGRGRAPFILTMPPIAPYVTAVIGDDIRIPIRINGIDKPQDVELSLTFDPTNLDYHGTTSLTGAKLDVTGTTTRNYSRIYIPASELKPNEVSAYANFNLFVDTALTSMVWLDSLRVLTFDAPCEYVTDTRTSTSAEGPSGCGIYILSDFLRYGKNTALRIYPNPTSGSFRIISSQNLPDSRIEIADRWGTILSSSGARLEKGVGVGLDASTLPSGIYFVRVIAEGFATVLPVVIEK
jgi:photosystem II stability/assembly factor-like uncharacterized protein